MLVTKLVDEIGGLVSGIIGHALLQLRRYQLVTLDSKDRVQCKDSA